MCVIFKWRSVFLILFNVCGSFGWNIRLPDRGPALTQNKLDPDVHMFTPTEERFNFIFPGTKWCGSGFVAENYNDLGYWESTDACCREHDLCSDYLEAGQSAHGLTNNGLYTKLNCECDYRFLECLRADSSKMSSMIGYMYFNTLDTQCFQEDYPIIRCSSYYPNTRRCKIYELNVTAALKKYQFFDVPYY